MMDLTNNDKWLWTLATVALFVLVFLGAGTCAPGPEKAAQTLRAHGFKDVKIVDSHHVAVSLRGCSDGDAVAHEARATNPAGDKVSVTVCCGMVFKGCTVRFP